MRAFVHSIREELSLSWVMTAIAAVGILLPSRAALAGFYPSWGPTPEGAVLRSTDRCIYYDYESAYEPEPWTAAALPFKLEFGIAAEPYTYDTEARRVDGNWAIFETPAFLVPDLEFSVSTIGLDHVFGDECRWDYGPTYLVGDLDPGRVDEPSSVAVESINLSDVWAWYPPVSVRVDVRTPPATVGGWVFEIRHVGHDHALAWLELQSDAAEIRGVKLNFYPDTMEPEDEVCLTGRYYTPFHEVDSDFELGCFTLPEEEEVQEEPGDDGDGCLGCVASSRRPPDLGTLLVVATLGLGLCRRE